MAGIRILGCGYSYGDRIVTNDDMAKIVDTSDAWIRRKTRRIPCRLTWK